MSRGTLRIYLGAAPGVGKTYAMLNEGRRRAARGEDVLVGFVESHGRQRTADQVGDLEVAPRAQLRYRDAVFEEMDLDAVLARRPELVLVDELAHTNIPGCRHEKRWQDVEELLDAGIGVITNLNIQHLESLNDVVEEITGVVQRETIPDEIVRRADQLQLVDLAVETIRARLSRGDIYPAERIDAALGNYFRAGNLAALRELALLWIADRVEEGLAEYRVRHGISETWETRERVLVGLSGSADGDHLVRRAARMAQRMNADVIAVHVRPQTGLVSSSAEHLEQQGRLVERLGGTYREVAGADIGETLVDTARLLNATQIVIGAREQSSWNEFLYGSVDGTVIRRSGVGLDVHVIAKPPGAPSPQASAPRLRRPRALPRRRVALGFALAGVGAPLLTLALSQARDQVSPSGALLLFLLLVVFVSALGGMWPALTAAIGGFLLVNWFLTPPLYTWTVGEPRNVLALFVFLAVAIVMSSFVALAARRTAQATRARAKAETLMRLAGTSSVPAILRSLRRAFDLDGAALLRRRDGGWDVEVASGDAPTSPEGAALVIEVDDERVLAAAPRPFDVGEDARMLEAFAKELATSVEFGELEAEAATAGELAAVNELRTSLLSSVSHDLRTPLAAIKASATSLLQDDVEWTDEAERELLTTIDEETDRLNRLVGSLLDMSRLQTGVLDVHRELVMLDEVLTEALASIGAGASSIALDLPDGLPPVLADEALLERALANVVANALAYAGSQGVRVVAGPVHDRVDVRIVDHGPGVPEDERDGIFQPFRRLGDSRRREGVGLGLAIAKGFVEGMGGTIEAETTPGGGLTIVIGLETSS
jgi:two-component system, OmpR family, sensor histidine kinase KdpD